MSEDIQEVSIQIAATGNEMKSHKIYDTFMEISGTPTLPGHGGNRFDDEIHIRVQSNDGEFSQGWFRSSDILNALSYMGF